MSRVIHSHAARMLAVAGFLSIGSMVTPKATHAQTSSERALLNRTAAVSGAVVTVAHDPSRTVDGASALLGKSTVSLSSERNVAIDSVGEAGPIDGEQALLNKFALPETRRLALAK